MLHEQRVGWRDFGAVMIVWARFGGDISHFLGYVKIIHQIYGKSASSFLVVICGLYTSKMDDQLGTDTRINKQPVEGQIIYTYTGTSTAEECLTTLGVPHFIPKFKGKCC